MIGSVCDKIDVLSISRALVNEDDYDGFVIDEADRCLIEKGTVIDENKGLVKGFWDLLSKKAFLLTASCTNDMSKLLREAYGVTSDKVMDHSNLIQEFNSTASKYFVSYKVCADLPEYWKSIEELIK